MKKIKSVALLLTIFTSFGMNAQTQIENKAQKFIDEITKVLELNDTDSKAIYQIQLERFKENKAIESEYGDKPEEKKEKLKDLGNKIFNKMKAVLGSDRQKKWKEYKENK
jgi:polyhydroxyalkanoate synthesis regulator phasin